MTTVSLEPETLEQAKQFNAGLEQLLQTVPAVHTVDPVVTRQNRLKGTVTLPPPEVLPQGVTRNFPGPTGEVTLRVFLPPEGTEPVGVYLHIHGGGWVLGSALQQDVALWRVASRASLAVVSVEYRLAPEHPYPAGADDCEAAALWLLENAAREFGSSKLAIGGESAGAHLAAVTLLRLRDRHGLTAPFSAANLVYGAFDMGMTPSQRRWGDRNLILSTPIMAWFYDCFLPGMTPEERRNPEYSPLYADLAGLPQALFTVGALDPLLDDTLFMAARWQAAGNQADLQVYPEAVHGFNGFPTALGTLTNDAQVDFLKRTMKAGA